MSTVFRHRAAEREDQKGGEDQQRLKKRIARQPTTEQNSRDIVERNDRRVDQTPVDFAITAPTGGCSGVAELDEFADNQAPGAPPDGVMAVEGDAQRHRGLEASFSGKKGGPGEVLGSLVTKWPPAKTARITVEGGTTNSCIRVGAVGQVKRRSITDERGRTAKLLDTPVLGAVLIENADLARADGSQFADPDMRRWQSGGHGSMSPFSWTA